MNADWLLAANSTSYWLIRCSIPPLALSLASIPFACGFRTAGPLRSIFSPFFRHFVRPGPVSWFRNWCSFRHVAFSFQIPSDIYNNPHIYSHGSLSTPFMPPANRWALSLHRTHQYPSSSSHGSADVKKVSLIALDRHMGRNCREILGSGIPPMVNPW